MHLLSISCLLFFVQYSFQDEAPTGSVQLDELSFNKVTNKFKASLVKFDVAFPYGDKHDAYVAIARDAKEINDLLVAEVGVKDYGIKENEALARKYGVSKDDFPVVKLFVKGKNEPLTFDEKQGFTTDDLRKFVRAHTGLYLSLPGCDYKLDMLALKFMKADEEGKKGVIKETEQALNKFDSKDATSGKIYKTIMEKILEKGIEFSKSEIERVKKLISGKLSDEKKKELNIRLNILHTFQLDNIQSKDEL